MLAIIQTSLIAMVAGHGAMVQPRSRNAVDWLAGVNTQRCSNSDGSKCNNGQAAFWYSQGCFIGCPTCDNASGRRQVDLCGLGKKQTLTDPKYWSVNRDAPPGSDLDIYKHNPWRAPGAAPVMDACGLAGGSYSRKSGAEAGDYQQTQFAQHGDVGTQVLKPLPAANYTPPVYKRGGTAEVLWSIRNNHGGGYQYRLCKTPTGNFTQLTEECFQKTPLDFVKDAQAIVFPDGRRQFLLPNQTTFVSEGTMPTGSTWSMMPMPPTLLGPCCLPGAEGYNSSSTPHTCISGQNGQCLDTCSPCPGTPGSDCSRCDQVSTVLPGRYKNAPQFPPPCEECQGVDWGGLSVRDLVKIPETLAPGNYILGFRYDCEATAQVWSNCADVVIE
jgi:hypothetical protein